MAHYLEVRSLSKSFGDFTALRDVSLDIGEGEFVCFLGPSGCGKTTLLRAIAGLDPQSSGTIHQAGRDVSLLPPAKRDFGIVFQSYALFPNLTVGENVAYGLVSRGETKTSIATRVTELLALVGLPDSAVKYPAQLSGGQQQRVALARALATSPGLLLLDEPLSALDARVRIRLRHEIKALQRRLGVTTIMVTHDQEEALSVADRIVVMNHGVIEQVGTPLQVYREPASAFVAGFVGRINALPARVAAGGALQIGSRAFPGGHAGAAGSEVTVYLRPEDVLARPIAPGEPHAFDAQIQAIEFLGAYCLVTVQADALGGQALQVVLSLNFLSEQALAVGSQLPLRLLPERLRVFA
jgi:iron(III) transport system ATP-binding protein